MPKYWGLSFGEGGKYIEHGKRGSYIAVEWGRLGDLSWLLKPGENKDRLRSKFTSEFKEVYPGSPIQVGLGTGQVWSFVAGMSEGDIVLVRDPVKRRVHIVKVAGGYEYKQSAGDGCPYPHRRAVTWLKEIPRDGMSQKLRDSMGSLLTIFNVNKHAREIEGLLNGTIQGGGLSVETGQELRKGIIQRLLDLSPVDFEEFIKDLLSTLGFETTRTAPVGDKGVDVVGTLNAEGVANINLRVQVKRYGYGSVGIDDVLKIRGTLALEDNGALVTTSKFTKQAQEEAQRPGMKPIALIDGDTLVELILKHFDALSPEHQTFLGLREKEVPLDKRFELVRQG